MSNPPSVSSAAMPPLSPSYPLDTSVGMLSDLRSPLAGSGYAFSAGGGPTFGGGSVDSPMSAIAPTRPAAPAPTGRGGTQLLFASSSQVVTTGPPSVGGGSAASSSSSVPPSPVSGSLAGVREEAAAMAVRGTGPEVEVGIHIYDLTSGLARHFAPMLSTSHSNSDHTNEAEAAGLSDDHDLSLAIDHPLSLADHQAARASAPRASRFRVQHMPTARVGGADGYYGAAPTLDGRAHVHRRHGVLHSALVVYGFEYYFEGGICRSPRGETRFGRDYRYLPLGTTRVSQALFEAWVIAAERTGFGLATYDMTRLNCHCFTDAAVQVLTGRPGPSFLHRNTQRWAEAPIARIGVPVLYFTNGAMLRQAVEVDVARLAQREAAAKRAAKIMHLALVPALPPRFVFLYGSSDSAAVASAIRGILRTLDPDADPYVPSDAEIAAIDSLAQALPSGEEQLDPRAVANALFALGVVAEHRASWQLGPLLEAWQALLLHKTIVAYAVVDQRLNVTLMRLCRDFLEVGNDVRVGLLRVLCNLAAAAQGAAAITDPRRVPWFIFAGSAALLEVQAPEVVDVGASLLLNIAVALVTVGRGFLLEHGGARVADTTRRLVTIFLYHICNPASSDQVVLKLISGLCWLCEASSVVAFHVAAHELTFSIIKVMNLRCGPPHYSRNRELFSLLCMFSYYIEDATGGPPSDDEQQTDDQQPSPECGANAHAIHVDAAVDDCVASIVF